jgi:hypothetical protein
MEGNLSGRKFEYLYTIFKRRESREKRQNAVVCWYSSVVAAVI